MPHPQDLKHIYYFYQGSSETYKGKSGNGGKQYGHKNRQQHGSQLIQEFENAWKQAQAERQKYPALAVKDKHGMFLEFEIIPGYEDVLQKFDRKQDKTELRAVRSLVDGDITKKLATVFIPDDKENVFTDKFNAYLYEEKTSKKGKVSPKEQAFAESLEHIKLAVLQSFWTDIPELFPQDETENFWWEVWLSIRDMGENLDAFQNKITELGLGLCSTGFSDFPERKVTLLYGNRKQIQILLDQNDQVSELRRAKDAVFFLEQSRIEQREWETELLERIQNVGNGKQAICILDSGVNKGSPLIAPFLNDHDRHAYHPSWTLNDQDGHGTAMAGLALYGDLTEALASTAPIEVPYHLESVKIKPPSGFEGVDKPEFSAMTVESVARVEVSAPLAQRVYCLAVAAKDGRERGQPSLWSANVDRLSVGVHQQPKRLFVLAAGNQSFAAMQQYIESNFSEDIHDPGQAWNALTVGAYTEKVTIAEPDFQHYQPIAPAGDLCPTSSTSVTWLQRSRQRARWSKKWPNKPDFVLEGGNYALDPSGQDPTWLDSLSLLSIDHRAINHVFKTMRDTSAATAQAARMAGRLWAAYPELWPETLRALLVHTADWTPGMWSRVKSEWPQANQRERFERLLCLYGYGVPQLNKALWSAQNRLVMMVQDTLQPFKKNKGKSIPSFNEMHLQNLPWPTDVLASLGETEVSMRVTLSYFIEPGPGHRGFSQRYRYASHGLRFDVKTPEESPEQFRKRLNPDETSETESDSQAWDLGPDIRHRGSVHSDIWRGTAAQLASRGVIGVYPVTGWWKERTHCKRWDAQARYALIVSIETPEVETDIYTPVQTQTQISIENQV